MPTIGSRIRLPCWFLEGNAKYGFTHIPVATPGPRPCGLSQCTILSFLQLQALCWRAVQPYRVTQKLQSGFYMSILSPSCRLWVPKDLPCGLLCHEGAGALLEYPAEHQWPPRPSNLFVQSSLAFPSPLLSLVCRLLVLWVLTSHACG